MGLLQDNTDILKSAVSIKYLTFCLSDQKVLWLMPKCLHISHEYLQWGIASNSRTAHTQFSVMYFKKSSRKKMCNIVEFFLCPERWKQKSLEEISQKLLPLSSLNWTQTQLNLVLNLWRTSHLHQISMFEPQIPMIFCRFKMFFYY